MTQFATVERFCAIEDTSCEKMIPFNGPWSFFFAYPSSTAMQNFSKELVTELETRGVRGQRWEDLVTNNLLFSKVCEGIYSNDFLLAEVSEPNLNVLLEVGYALAVGRQPVLIKNKNRKQWTRELLTTLESCFYETRQDIYEYIARWQSQSPVPGNPDRQLPFLENMGIYDHQEVRGTAYHLKPKVPTDWISRVDRAFSKSPFKLSSMDPSDSVYDEFYPQARQIQRASLVVASFVSKDTVNWQQNNASVALLTGFAIGLGKQALVLQEEPIAPILDLGSVARPFEGEYQVDKIVEAWINKQVRISIRQSIESRQRATSRQRTDRLRNIYLGHPDALQDNELLKYFVPTKEFDDAIEGRRTILIGRRGSGKSANFQAIRADIAENPNVVDVEILPDDFQLESITRFLEQATDLPDPQLIFQSIWNYVLTTEMLKSLVEKTDRLFSSPDEATRSKLRQIYDSDSNALLMDFGNRVVLALSKVLSQAQEISAQERILIAEEGLKDLRNYTLNRLLRDFAREEGFTYFIVADDLDKHWRANTRLSIDLLLGLVAEVARMQRFMGKYLKIVLFLREDIYDVLTTHDDDLPKRDILRMEWTVSNLHHLVAARLSTKIEIQDDDEVWSAIFPEPVGDAQASDYILSRSLPRPRDVLNLCQRAIDQAQRNGHEFVTARDILDGEKSFSEALFYSVSSEFKGLYPRLEEVLIEFAGVAKKIEWDEFQVIAMKCVENHREIVDEWVSENESSPDFLAEVLFTIGLIGLSREWRTPVHFCNGRSFSETWGLVSAEPVVHIHPAFVQFLEISEAVLRPPVRPSRRRKRVSPFQTSFDDSVVRM